MTIGPSNELPGGWDPAPLVEALRILVGDEKASAQLIFDFGEAGQLEILMDIDPNAMSENITDGLLAQLAQISLLAGRSHCPLETK